MSRNVCSDVPDVTIKPENISQMQWTKGLGIVLVFVAAMVFYTITLVLLKSLYAKDEWLDRISVGVQDTERMIQSIKSMDLQLVADIGRLA